MKLIIMLVVILLSFCVNSFAEKYYIFIEKNGFVEDGEEAGMSEKGDVIDICPFTSQHMPTKTEESAYEILVSELTEKQKVDLLEPIKNQVGENIKNRKRKIDTSKITFKNKDEVDVKKITDNTIDKSVQQP